MKLDNTGAPKSHEQLDAKGLDKQKVVMTLTLFCEISNILEFVDPHECLLSLNLQLTFTFLSILYS